MNSSTYNNICLYVETTEAMNQSNYSNTCYSCSDTIFFEISVPLVCFALLLFVTAISLVAIFKLHKLLVYRLALYQVISATLSLVIFFVYELYLNGCITVNFEGSAVLLSLIASSVLLKSILTLWIIFHLYALSMCHRNCKKLEKMYIGSSIVVSIVVFILTLTLRIEEITNYRYDTSPASDWIELLSLTCIVLLLLLLSLPLIFIMGVTLCCRACETRNGVTSEHQNEHKTVLYEMVPLLVYPILYLVLSIPFLLYLISFYAEGVYMDSLFFQICQFAPPVAVFFWNITCSCTLIIHVLIMISRKKPKILKRHRNDNPDTGQQVTVNETTALVLSDTHFSLPTAY